MLAPSATEAGTPSATTIDLSQDERDLIEKHLKFYRALD
jgi:hypothetical protein